MTSKIWRSPSNSRLHGRLEALEDVVEVDREALEAHEAVPKEKNADRTRKSIEKSYSREESFAQNTNIPSSLKPTTEVPRSSTKPKKRLRTLGRSIKNPWKHVRPFQRRKTQVAIEKNLLNLPEEVEWFTYNKTKKIWKLWVRK